MMTMTLGDTWGRLIFQMDGGFVCVVNGLETVPAQIGLRLLTPQERLELTLLRMAELDDVAMFSPN